MQALHPGAGPALCALHVWRAAEWGGGGAEEASSASSSSSGEEHSFHLHCVTDAQAAMLGGSSSSEESGQALECPLCAPLQRQVREIRASLGPRPGLAEQFFQELRASPDGFAKAAEYLSKGIMDVL